MGRDGQTTRSTHLMVLFVSRYEAEDLAFFSALKILDLSDNRLGEVAPLAALPGLRQLYVQGNALRGGLGTSGQDLASNAATRERGARGAPAGDASEDTERRVQGAERLLGDAVGSWRRWVCELALEMDLEGQAF